MLFGAGCGFALVDAAAAEGGFGSVWQTLQVEKTGQLDLALRLGEKSLRVDLSALNGAAGAAQQHGFVIVPRGVRLLAHWAAAGRQWYDDAVTRSRERDFYENAGLF